MQMIYFKEEEENLYKFKLIKIILLIDSEIAP